MSIKLDVIQKDAEDVRIFTGESYLVTTHFVIFLLFGCNEEQSRALTTKANKLIAERQAFVVIDASGNPGVVQSVEDAIEKVSDAQIDVENLTEMHLCPVIISENANPEKYCEIIFAVNAYLQKRDIRTEWKAFLLLNTILENAAAWLDAIDEGIRSLGSMRSCRCCVMTRKDEDGFGVAEERLLTTILFIAFLNTVNETREELGRQIVIEESAPDSLFYTAQTALIENPVVTRIFKRMGGLLERLCLHSPQERDIDMGFMQKILQHCFDKMPVEDGYVSLLPLYGVMPGPDFESRLRKFAYRHYLSFIQGVKEKNAVYAQITKGFLHSYLRHGKGGDGLASLIGNEEELSRLHRIQLQGINIKELIPYPGKQDAAEIYEKIAASLKVELVNIGKRLLESYFKSDEFTTLPRKYYAVVDKLNDIIKEMTEITRKRSKQDITLPLLNDPDEKWIESESKDSMVIDGFLQSFCYLALAESDEMFEDEFSALLDRLYQVSKSLSGGNSAQSYMKLVSDTCAETDSDAAKQCVKEIGGKLRFPVRVRGNIGKESSCTYVWGSEGNKLYSAWQKYHEIINARSTFLPLSSNERLAILRVSAPFSRQQILSIEGGSDE